MTDNLQKSKMTATDSEIARQPNRKTWPGNNRALFLRMDDLQAGTLFSLWMEFQCRFARLWKTFRSKNGMLFGFTTE